MTQTKNISAFILAGGKSTRMGSDKGLSLYRNKPFIKHIIDALSTKFKLITIISNTNNYNSFGYPVIEDLIKDKGPLAGIYTGLTQSNLQQNLFVSCDMPLLKENLITHLIEKADFTVDANIIIHNDKKEPLCGIYNKNIAAELKSLLDKNQLSIIKALELFKVNYIDITNINGIETSSLMNVNSKKELTELEEKTNG